MKLIFSKVDNGLKHGFGGRFSVSNCIYDNVMETIKSKCSCDVFSNCSNIEAKWECANREFEDPYDKYLQPLHFCKESCSDQAYTTVMDGSRISQDPKPLCGQWLENLKSKYA